MDSGGYAVAYLPGLEIGKTRERHELRIELVKGGIVEGRVFDAQGKPIESAAVHLKTGGLIDFESFTECKTDPTGFFRYLGIPPGACRLEFRHADYQAAQSEDLWVVGERTTLVEMTLHRK